MMTRFLTALVAVATTFCLQAEVWQAEYGVARLFNFKLYNADGTLDVDEVDSGTEVTLSCNEGAEGAATNDFIDEGNFYSISLTAAELQCERVAIVVAATITEVFFVQTFGHASGFNETLGWLTGDSFARLGAPAGASVSADIAAIEGQTDDIGAAGAGLTAADDAVITVLGTPAGASVSVDIAAIEGQTDDIGAAGAGLTAIDLPNQTMDITGNLSGSVGSVTAGVNTTSISGDSAAADALELAYDSTVGAVPELGITDRGTAQSATATTLVLRAATAFSSDDANLGSTLWAFGSTQGYWQSRTIDGYVTATDTATVATWDVTPSGTITYQIYGTAPGAAGSLTAADVWAAGTRTLTALDEDSTTLDLNATTVGTVTTLTGHTAQTGDAFARLGAPAGASVSADIAAIEGQTDDIGAAGAGLTVLATQASVNTVDDLLDTEIDALPTNAELATALGTADDATLAAIAALNNLSTAQVRDLTIEDQGGGVSLGCAIAIRPTKIRAAPKPEQRAL
jgi:predicted RNA-binding protein with TRAM domain